MNNELSQASTKPSVWRTVGIVLLTIILSVAISISVVMFMLFPGDFKPVTLNQKEEQQLEAKLQQIEQLQITPSSIKSKTDTVAPEPYSEADASRDISLSEKELNALLAKNTNMAHRLAIDLADNLASANLLVPMDPEFPVLGGKTVKMSAGLEMRFSDNRPVIILKGVSIWGVPVPNAWLGNLKNIDLVQEFGDKKGFWKSFADGIDSIDVKEGMLNIRLKE